MLASPSLGNFLSHTPRNTAGLRLSTLHILQLGKKEFLLGCGLHQTGLQWYLWGLFSISD